MLVKSKLYRVMVKHCVTGVYASVYTDDIKTVDLLLRTYYGWGFQLCRVRLINEIKHTDKLWCVGLRRDDVNDIADVFFDSELRVLDYAKCVANPWYVYTIYPVKTADPE